MGDTHIRRLHHLVDTIGPAPVPCPVFLTFDDGPHTEFTPRILDLLHARDVRATFFVVGMRAAAPSAKELLSRMTGEGHTIGNHSFSHRDLTGCDDQTVRDEIVSTERLLEGFASFRRVFRPPYGKTNARVLAVGRQLGYELILWNNDPRDWASREKPDKWVTNALAAVKTHDARLIVCHDTHRTTAAHLAQLLQELSLHGYVFATLADTRAAITPTRLKSSHQQPRS